jgi:hypothetical protein
VVHPIDNCSVHTQPPPTYTNFNKTFTFNSQLDNFAMELIVSNDDWVLITLNNGLVQENDVDEDSLLPNNGKLMYENMDMPAQVLELEQSVRTST